MDFPWVSCQKFRGRPIQHARNYRKSNDVHRRPTLRQGLSHRRITGATQQPFKSIPTVPRLHALHQIPLTPCSWYRHDGCWVENSVMSCVSDIHHVIQDPCQIQTRNCKFDKNRKENVVVRIRSCDETSGVSYQSPDPNEPGGRVRTKV